MFKCIALLRRRPDISHEAFVDLYDPVLVKIALNGSFC